MIESVVIIGCGSLGGYLVQSLSELEEIKKLVLIDFDRIQKKNIRNSIFRTDDIGRYKTVALSEIISDLNNNITIETIESGFIEGETKIPKCDLVIDCRDFIHDRRDIIDIRMYMSSRYLILDCRKNISYKSHYEGRYLHNLTKTDLRNATFIAAMFIHKGLIHDVIKNQMIHKIELDYLNRDIANTINLIKRKPDEIIEYHNGESKLINLSENLYKIKKMNKKNKITIYVGSKNYPVAEKQISQGQLKDSNDIIVCLIKMLELPYPFNNYIVSPGYDKGAYYIELLAETGAA
jgi:hypothetical protein